MYSIYTTCVDSSVVGEYGEDINEMKDSHHLKDIDSKNFLLFADKKGFKENVLNDFSMSSEEFINDFGISCHSSHFRGVECLYVYFSGIENVYIPNDQFASMGDSEQAESRREMIETLTDLVDDSELYEHKGDMKKSYNILNDFVDQYRNLFKENNILLASLFAYGNEYGDIVRKIDNDEFLGYNNDNRLSIG